MNQVTDRRNFFKAASRSAAVLLASLVLAGCPGGEGDEEEDED